MKVLIVGGGGREHALAWKAAQGQQVEKVYVAPGNAGTAMEPKLENVAIAAEDIDALLEFAGKEKIDLTIVGPEAPLVAGIVDHFMDAGLAIFGPRSAAAVLEGSKSFSKDFLKRFDIPTAEYQNFTEVDAAVKYIQSGEFPVVIKADGLAAGKGVVIAQDEQEAIATIHDMLAGN
ncbi:MAG: phosphoribosylamine--glycine ligase, partial [Gammaproteobacteria bacterium]